MRGWRPGRAANSREAVVANLQTLLAAYGVGPERLIAAHAMQHLIVAALDRVANK